MTKLPKALVAAIMSIVLTVVAVEGGYVNNPNDPGGATNHGVTEQVAREHGYTGPMRELNRARAIEIHAESYIVKPGFHRIIERSTALGEEVSDQSVNFGPHRPACWFQTALNSLNRQGRDFPDLQVDCRVGPASLAAYDTLARRRGPAKACELVLKLVEAQQGAEYLQLTAANARLEEFMPGWTDHRLGNVPLGRCSAGGAS